MPKVRTIFVCQQCGYESSGWLGKCPNCNSWSSFVEQVTAVRKTAKQLTRSSVSPPLSLTHVTSTASKRTSSLSKELDRVLGGGLVEGSVILLSGEPGIGKSTLILRLAKSFSQHSAVLYVSGEESPQQVKLRSERLHTNSDKIFIFAETDVDQVCAQMSEGSYGLVIIDSIQTMSTSDLTGVSGSVGQVRESTFRLQQTAKGLKTCLIVVGHVTKEGAIAGPKVLEHLVDVVLYLEGEKFSNMRLIRGVKNRFGPTDEVGFFTMEEGGLIDAAGINTMLLSSQLHSPGSAIIVSSEGTRPILIETQALTLSTRLPVPRRVSSGFDFNRLQMLVAVISRHLRLPLGDCDVYLNIASGFTVREPAADLGVVASIISSYRNKVLPPKSVFIGEVGLLGEIRKVTNLERRIKEAQQLGYTQIYTHRNFRSLKELFASLFK